MGESLGHLVEVVFSSVRSEIFVAPGFNPGEKSEKGIRPRDNVEKSVDLFSDGMELTIKKRKKKWEK